MHCSLSVSWSPAIVHLYLTTVSAQILSLPLFLKPLLLAELSPLCKASLTLGGEAQVGAKWVACQRSQLGTCYNSNARLFHNRQLQTLNHAAKWLKNMLSNIIHRPHHLKTLGWVSNRFFVLFCSYSWCSTWKPASRVPCFLNSRRT